VKNCEEGRDLCQTPIGCRLAINSAIVLTDFPWGFGGQYWEDWEGWRVGLTSDLCWLCCLPGDLATFCSFYSIIVFISVDFSSTFIHSDIDLGSDAVKNIQ